MEETLKNLSKAFIGESQARNRYTFYAKMAKQEGYEQIAEIFELTAEQEKQHAKWLMRLINQIKKDNKPIMVEAESPNVLGTTQDHLSAAIEGENYEHVTMYPEFATQAEKDGHQDIANRLRAIAKAEEHHEERYSKLLKELSSGTVFKKEREITWICRECGYVHTGKMPPIKCPSCDHPTAFFQKKCEEY